MKRLYVSGLGCYIGHIFTVVICYADDMKLLSQSERDYKTLLIFAKEFGT